MGFTFVETILCVVVIAAIASVVAHILLAGLDVYMLVVDRNNAFQNSRMAMDRMTDELIHLDSTDITWMSNERIGFRAMEIWTVCPHQGGMHTDFDLELASMGGNSTWCIYRGDDYLGGYETDLDFDYFNEDGGSAAWSGNVRRINIDFTVKTPRVEDGIRLRTDVFPRSFMYDGFR